MLTFKKARAKNFLSIGNHFLEYDLTADNLTLYKGKNSMGKSILSSILTFALFKKAYRQINLPQLVNNINKKDCLVEVEFKINKTEWMVRRGLSPAVFEIYKNGKLLDQHSSAVDQQKWFEQNVLKMNYKTFTQIVVLGTTNFIPFMQLTSADRREIVEELLDIKVFSSMNILVKENIKTLRDEIKLLRVKEVGMEEKIELQNNFIQQIREKKSANLQEKKEKIKRYQDEIEALFHQNKTLENKVSELNTELKTYSKSSSQLKKLVSLKGKIVQKLETLEDNHSFFENNEVCPTCSQELSADFKEEKLKESKEKIDEINSGYDDLIQTIKEEEKKEKKFVQLSKKISEINQEISNNNSKMNQYSSIILEIQKEIKDADNIQDAEIENEKLEKFHLELYEIKNQIIKNQESSQYYDYVNSILKDGGVKTIIISKYLPLINKKINGYLKMMELFINFSLDSEFNEIITTSTFENFSYGNFSEGQKQRINLALTFGLMSVAAAKNSVNTNLLILDEILDGSMDAEGISLFLAIIRKEMKNKNIFMISHRDNLDSKFDKVVEFQKKGNFTQKIEITK